MAEIQDEFENTNNNDVFVVNGVANYSFVKQNVNTVRTLSSCFGLVYKTGWYYKQWKEIKKCNESYKNISPFWRAIFYLGYAGQLKKIVTNLYEAKMNMILQNDTVSPEEKEVWQKEHKKLNSIFANFSLTQQAINKVVPFGHPDGKTTGGSFLGLIPLAIIIMIILGFNVISFLFNGCFEAEGNVLKNTCENFSLTFPLDGEIGLARNNGFEYYCQGSETNHVCMTMAGLDNPADFNLDTLSGWESDKILSKTTAQYAGNTTYCFKEENKDKQIFNVCYMQVKRAEPFYFLFYSQNETGSVENLEKLMNSYKNL